MRIFSTIAETHQIGVTARLAANGNYYEIAVSDALVLAKVSYESMLQLLARGDAICMPSMNWKDQFYRTEAAGRAGGTTIIRADYELKDSEVWLTPEGSPSLNVLHVIEDSAALLNIGCANATVLASVRDKQNNCHFHLGQLRPGGSLIYEGTFHEQGSPYQRVIAHLSEDASTIKRELWRDQS